MHQPRRGQFSVVDVLMAIGILVFLLMLIPAALLSMRESARLRQCQDNLRRIGTALEKHHEAKGNYPPASIQPNRGAVWRLKDERERLAVTHANWAILLLPYLDEEQLAAEFHAEKPISDPSNLKLRTTELPWMTCPADTFHHPDNPFRCILNDGQEILYARGNYAINAGSSSRTAEPGDPNRPVPDGATSLSEGSRRIQWGNGIAGINKSFSKRDIVNGLSTTVAIDEIRAGIASMDSRGSWALGHHGCSITYSHGVYSDATGPNCQRRTADRIVGGMELMKVLGRPKVMREGMPCPFYFYGGASQATARSKHAGGVNVLMLDGSVHFVSDQVDLNIWHAIHSRKTPEEISVDSLAVQADPEALDVSFYGPYAVPLEELAASCAPPPPRRQSPMFFTNSIGIKFVKIPAGEFVMGMPDKGRGVAYRAATPAHVVHITKPFCLGVYAVTQDEYRRVMKRNPSWFSPTGGGRDQLQGDDTHDFLDQQRPVKHKKVRVRGNNTSSFPVENVSWHDAVKFCRRLSELPAEKGMGRRYRLPTEAEWEYAARGGSSDQGKNGMAHSIGVVYLDKPNTFGICGVNSSVWEWCSDGFSRYYYARSPRDDPRGASSVYLRVARGSAWAFTGDYGCQFLNPRGFPPSTRNRFLGFRVVCTKRTQ